MSNVLNGKVQVVEMPALRSSSVVVWYRPEGFPGVLTDATLIDGDGDLLLVRRFRDYRLISVQQVHQIEHVQMYEAGELYATESAAYDAEGRS